MALCKHCGANIPDHAKFCPKCGISEPVQAPQPAPTAQVDSAALTQSAVAPPEQTVRAETVQQPQSQQTPPPVQPVAPPPQYTQNAAPQQKQTQQISINFTKFADYYVLLFAIFGAVSYVLMELGGTFIVLSEVFGIILSVFAILCDIVFIAVTIVGFIAAKSADTQRKHSLRNALCLSLGIIIFAFVLLSCIAIFVLGGKLY